MSQQSKNTAELAAPTKLETPAAASADAIASFCTQAGVTVNELENKKLFASCERNQQKQQMHPTAPDRTGDILQQATEINDVTAKTCSRVDSQSSNGTTPNSKNLLPVQTRQK